MLGSFFVHLSGAKGEKYPGKAVERLKKRYVMTAILAMAGFILLGIANGQEPEEAVLPQATALPVAEVPRIDADAQVYQTMYFTRCGHSVSRRTDAAKQVQGADFDQVRSYYEMWTVLELTENRVEMERQIALFCPMHKVLSLTEAGQVVLSENRYGDGMAILKTYDAVIKDEETRNLLIAGQGFDSEEMADLWLQEREVLP